MASAYPGGLDSYATNHQDNVGEVIHASFINDLDDAVNKIEAELGLLPKGTYATLRARLDALELVTYNLQVGTAYTLVLADKNKIVNMQNAAANTLTVPPNSSVAYPIGVTISIKQGSSGQTTVVPGSGVTISSRGAALKTAGQFAFATLIKNAIDGWDLIGDITT